MQAKTIFFFVTVKLIEYIFSAISICSSPSVGPIPRTYIFFFLLSIWTEELISTPKINIFLPNPPLGNEKLPLLSNPVPQPECPYFSISTFFVKVTAPNKQFFSVGSLSLELEAPSSQTM